MASEPITLMVSPETAKVYRETTEEGRRKMELVLDLWGRPVGEAVMRPLAQRRQEFLRTLAEVQEMAAANGLTEEILEQILRDE